MLRSLRSNPLLDQTLRTGRWRTLRVTLALLIALLFGAMVSQGWLIDHLPIKTSTLCCYSCWDRGQGDEDI